MSYKDKPQLKLYKYENSAFVLQAIIDDFQEVSFEHNIYEAGQFTISINYNIPNALKFERGLFIQFGSNPYDFGEILTVQDSIGEDGKGSQIRTITGYDARYLLKRRVIKNMNSNGLWSMTDKGEIVLRNLIKDQCGSGAEAKRQLPITNVIPATESALGNEFSVSESFTNLYEVCKTIATQSEIGWRIKFDGTLTLEVYQGQDLSQTVRFDTNFESLANGEFSDSAESYTNAIYIGGKGQNDDRDIYEGEDGTPEGLDRFESWDNQSSMTTEDEYEAEALSMLTQYGQTLTMNGNGLAKCPYVFREQYDIGDSVTVAFSGKSAKAQILSITEHWTWGSYDISFAFGKPQNNLADQLQLMLRKIQEASNKTNSTDSVRWYTIPTDTAMPKADVTYNTIGFQGTCAEGGSTFTLYLDTEKTGAKTYHVYFKQLAGGNLTLTTGRSGATDLVLNSGTYVAIIYVDENGNVTTQGATPTSTIQAGNVQPATSSGVAGAISSEATARDTAISNALALPTDAVLHYSFDEVPDYPDGSAVYKKLSFDSTTGWSAFNATLAIANGLKVQSNGTQYYFNALINGLSASDLSGKIIKMKLRSNRSFTFNLQDNGGSYSTHALNIINLGNNEYLVQDIIPTVSYNQLFTFNFGAVSASDYVTIETIYIGDGSYSTPVIDNADGQWNSISQSGVAVKGVSGKGIRFLGSNYIQGNLPWKPWYKQTFTMSIWVKDWDKATILPLINTWIGYAVNAIGLWVKTGANSIELDVPNSTGVQRFKIYKTRFDPTTLDEFCLTVVCNGAKTKLYVNGEQIQFDTRGTSHIGDGQKEVQAFQIGRYKTQSSYDYGNAIVDDFLIFDRLLSETEVQALYLNKANTPKYYSWADWKLSQV